MEQVKITSGNNGRQQRTRAKLLNVAMSLLAKKPTASMTDIAMAADVGRATLFRHFSTRKQLIQELVSEAENSIESAVRPILNQDLDTIEALRRIIKVLVPLGAGYHFLSSETINSEPVGLDAIYNTQLSLLKELTMRLKHDGIVAPDIPLAWVAAVLDNLIYTAWVTISDGDIAPNDAPALVLKSFLYGLAPT